MGAIKGKELQERGERKREMEGGRVGMWPNPFWSAFRYDLGIENGN